nr:uncharacterized protein LOC118078511 [Zootoca vivipara]XP_034958297.1 uncharacterized protein LOC118078511 [Zootoca vivipara]
MAILERNAGSSLQLDLGFKFGLGIGFETQPCRIHWIVILGVGMGSSLQLDLEFKFELGTGCEKQPSAEIRGQSLGWAHVRVSSLILGSNLGRGPGAKCRPSQKFDGDPWERARVRVPSLNRLSWVQIGAGGEGKRCGNLSVAPGFPAVAPPEECDCPETLAKGTMVAIVSVLAFLGFFSTSVLLVVAICLLRMVDRQRKSGKDANGASIAKRPLPPLP